MVEFEPIWALGLMSGTSMDGVDGAMVLTDGERIVEFGKRVFRPYDLWERTVISAAQGLWPQDDGPVLQKAKNVVEDTHLQTIGEFESVDLVGFHGQTLAHDPVAARTHQLGDGNLIALNCQKPVVWDFRSADMDAGGEGAPLAPFFHFACAKWAGLTEPAAFLNLGGVGNVTIVDSAKAAPEEPGALVAFDTGPANAPIDDLMQQRLGKDYDRDGALAASGQVDDSIIAEVLGRAYFNRPPPKSLDRNDFADVLDLVAGLSDADAAATLTTLSAACVAQSQQHLETVPTRWLVCGGGAKNPTLMRELAKRLNAPVQPVEHIGLNGDMLEAQAFAYLAVRVLRGLPTSGPGTTGCREPVCGGRVTRPNLSSP
ncbi:MAG: anhydro-N-acetylmuramic acid kinase [Rhodobacteraceae bacterium]|nr:anhydro-N-acetylmuramic acid kinase [Paracoccaceae bacterium]